ncbi:MarR family transcriptional regulator, partial [Klebsiella pneumoniae]|nr:MarR family transcriptional regulator [Klebsiella pneumoniae]
VSVKRTLVTRQLKTLEGLGWIARSMDTRDNRVTNVRLTETGQAITKASLPRRNAFLHDTMTALPDEALSALSGALTLLEERIGEVEATANAANAESADVAQALDVANTGSTR